MKVTGDSPRDAKITTNQEFDAFRFTNMLPFAQTDTFEDLMIILMITVMPFDQKE
jgi:hypothetical protein